ncbi:MAG: apolipoprotein N-acyltransferase [Pseudomonadota bacterium]
MRLPAQLAIALLAGLAHALSIAEPWSGRPLWWLQLLSLGVLAWLLTTLRDASASPRHAAWLGLAFGTAWLAATWWWLFISLHTYGGLNPALAVLAIVGLAAFLSLYCAAASAAFVWLAPSSATGRAALFAALWLLEELMRAVWFTGFPWGAAGYAHVDGPLAGLAPQVGVWGITAFAAFSAMALAQLVSRPLAWRARLAGGAVLAALWGWLAVGSLCLGNGCITALAHDPQSAGRLKVTLLQGNIPQDEKFQPGSGIPLALGWYREQILAAGGDLVVAPETAIPLLPQQLPEGYVAALEARFATGRQALLVGIPLGDFKQGYSNSAIGLRPGLAAPYVYSKHHLVPFGEFIPPLFRWFTELMNIPLGDFNRGGLGQPSFDWQGQRLAPNICYEDLFGEEIAAGFADAQAAPTILVNLSNIGWFGDSVAIDQHLLISRMRALEFDRPMIRATNTGATVIIDRRGRVTHALPRHTRGVLVGEVEGRYGITPFAWWASRFGVWPLWGIGLLALALAWLARRRSVPGG